MKALSAAALLLILPTAWGRDEPRIKLTAVVADDAGVPVEAASVETDVFDRWEPGEGFGKDLYKHLGVTADEKGRAVLETSSARCDLVLTVSKEGHYDSFATFSSTTKDSGRWQPWDAELPIILTRKLNPIPLIAKHVRDGYAGYVRLPLAGEEVGFDLEMGDWVAPHGKGITPDLLFHLKGRTDQLAAPYDAALHISFANPLDGLVPHEADPARSGRLRLPHLAPETGYRPALDKRKARLPGPATGVDRGIDHIVDDSRPSENYFLRVRTVTDDQGEIVSTRYGKIYGGFVWVPDGSLRFQYHFNPAPNDRNLEFDPARNLLQVEPGQEVSDP